MAQRLVEMPAQQRVLDAVAPIIDVVVADAALRERAFGLGSQGVTRLPIIGDPQEHAEHHGACEAHARLAHDRQRFMQLVPHPLDLAARPQRLGLVRQHRRQIAARPELARELHGANLARLGLRILRKAGEPHAHRLEREHLRVPIAHPRRHERRLLHVPQPLAGSPR